MDVVTIETHSLGDRTSVLVVGDVAAVVDPQRDIDRVLAVLHERQVRLTHVFETHVHNDYVTGGLELARRTGAAYHLHADEDVAYQRTPLRDGDVVEVGDCTVRAVHTPGHTPLHLTYVARDPDGSVAVFTGGSMLYGSVGRTDLVAEERTEELTRHQYRSVRRLADELPAHAEVRPTHGFGSFCSSGETSEADLSTIGEQRSENQALTIDDEDAFVRELLAGLDAYPSYYAHMAPVNRDGPSPVDLSPAPRVDTAELLRRVHVGEWVVDLRERQRFAARHLHGTVNVELADEASTHLAWLVPWGTPVTLLADEVAPIEAMQRQLVRVGIDRPAGQHPDGVQDADDDATGTYELTDFAGLREAVDGPDDPWILDVRRRGEWVQGHLPGAHHVPLHELPDRMDDVPTDRAVWVHCESGYRSSIAASLLARSGRRPVLVDDSFADHAVDAFDLVTD